MANDNIVHDNMVGAGHIMMRKVEEELSPNTKKSEVDKLEEVLPMGLHF